MPTPSSSSDTVTGDDEWLFDGSFTKLSLESSNGRRIIAGYANVAGVVDKQDEKVTIGALDRAWDKWSARPEYCMIMLMHTSTPVAKVLFEPIVDSTGQSHVSGTNEHGLYLVAEWRDDTVLANRAWQKVESGEMRGFSIGGIRISKRRECVGDVCFTVLEDLEIYETSAVQKPANEWSVFGMLKSDLMELSKISNLFKESVIAEDMVKVSKTRSCECGKYHIVLGKGLEGLKDTFETENTRVVEKQVEGIEYVPLFDLALLRPYSLEDEVMTTEMYSGGFESSPIIHEPESEGTDLKKEEVKDGKEVEAVVEIVKEPKTEVIEPVDNTDAFDAFKIEIAQMKLELDALRQKVGEPVEPEVVAVEPIVTPSLEGSEGSVHSVEVVEPVVVTPKVVEPVVVVAPEPVKVEVVPETRGKVIPPTGETGLDLAAISALSWAEINELAPDHRR